MLKYLKKIVVFFVSANLILMLSCNTGEEVEKRTFDDERMELDSMINKLMEEGFDIDTTDGVYYIVKEKIKEEGPFPTPGDTCYIEYRLYLPSGQLIRESYDYNTSGIIIFLFGEPGVPDMTPGWANGIRKMNKGSEMDFYVPSNLAYGSSGTQLVPPFTTLIYRTKMHDLRPKK